MSEERKLVPYFDCETGTLVQMPASELAPGCMQVRIEGKGIVWVQASQLMLNDFQHPPFGEPIHSQIEEIRESFSDQMERSFEEWENGFRRDRNPAPEIALFLFLARLYKELSSKEESEDRRTDIYRTLMSCLLTSRDGIWSILKVEALSRAEAEVIIDRYYKESGAGESYGEVITREVKEDENGSTAS